MPAVSTSSIRRPSTSIGVSIASRVVPATSRDDHALAAEERVDERGLADVRAADDGEPDEVLVLLGCVLGVGRDLEQAVEQVAGPETLGGGHRQRLAEAEAVEVVDEHEVARRVDLVRGDHHRQLAAAQDLRDLLVARAQRPRARRPPAARPGRRRSPPAPGPGSRRRAGPRPRGRRRRCRSASAGGRSTRCVSSLRSRVIPGRSCTTASRDCGEPVDERGLADVRVADDRDLHRSSRASTASVTNWPTTSSSDSPVVSSGIASGAGSWTVRSALASRRSRSSWSRRTCVEVASALLEAATGALVRVGGQEDLDRGVRRDHGRDVAALGDPVAVGHDRLLLGDEHRAHRGVRRHPRGGRGDLRRADRIGHVAAVDEHAVAALDADPVRDARRAPRPPRGSRARRRGTSPPCRGR